MTAEPQFRTNDIFVSYSRKDKPFVERLVKAFQDAGRDVWVDWEDIPLTAEWREEIRKGIEEADNFLIVISPDAMRSEVILNTEIAHAVKHNKRFVPVLHRRLEPDQKVPDSVRSHNWIYMRDEDDFDSGFSGLLKALNTDLEYVQAHTRITTRAVQWEQMNRDSSYLLSGRELSESQTWLSQVADKTPPVTVLQSEFIYESGRHEKRRGRQMLGAVTVALLVSVALTVLSVVFFRQADAARDLAEEKTQIVQSLELAANSQVALNSMSDGDLAIALALESIQRLDFPPVQAQLALAEAAYSPGTLYNIDGHTTAITAAAVTNGVAFLVTADADGKIIFHDMNNAETVATVEMFAPVIEIYTGLERNEVLVLSESAGGTHVDRMRPHEGDVTMEEVMFIEGESDRYQSMAYLPSDNMLAAVNGAGRVDVWTGNELTSTFNISDTADAIVFSPDGAAVAIATGEGDVAVWDSATGDVLATMEVDNVEGEKNSMEFNAEGTLLVAGTSVSNVVAVWDAQTGRLIDRFFGHSDAVYDVFFGDGGEMVVSGSQDGSVNLWDVGTGLQLREFVGHDSGVLVVHHIDGPDYILSGAANGTVRLWDAHNGAVMTLFHEHQAKVHAVAYSPDGSTVFSGSRDGVLYVQETANNNAPVRIQGHDDVVWAVDYNPRNPEMGASASADGTVRLWNLRTGEELYTFTGHDAPLWSLAFHPNGERVLSGDEDGITILWDATTGEEIMRVDGHSGQRVRALAFAPDGRSFASGGADESIALWDTGTGEEITRFTGHTDWIWSIDYSRDGSQIVSSAGESTILVWNVETGETIYRLEGHAGPVYDVAFDPERQLLISAASDSTIRMWNLADGREIRRYVEHSRGVWDIAFSPNGEFFVSGSGDHTVAIWNVVVGKDELIEWTLNNRFVRDLTCDERRMFNVDPQCNADGLVEDADD
ncbi:MAG: TIR domain-containing protein [Chloroflexota bacterium]